VPPELDGKITRTDIIGVLQFPSHSMPVVRIDRYVRDFWIGTLRRK
jgi:hypothetical protein